MLTRRQFLGAAAAVPLAGLAAGLYTWQVEPYWVEYVHQTLPVKNLPAPLQGRTLIQLSDIHIGNRFDWSYILRAFDRIKALKPDFVVYTGDYVSYEDEQQFGQLEEAMRHAPLGTIGTAAVLGNHDYGHGWVMPDVADQITAILNGNGLTVLRNEFISLGGLNVIGLDDFWGTNYNPEAILGIVDPNEANIVLSHNPDSADDSVWQGYQGWILSGHTHGGQVKPPFLEPPRLPVRNKRYSSGVVDLFDGRTLYINRALGNLWPVRFNMRPEVTIFTLQPA